MSAAPTDAYDRPEVFPDPLARPADPPIAINDIPVELLIKVLKILMSIDATTCVCAAPRVCSAWAILVYDSVPAPITFAKHPIGEFWFRFGIELELFKNLIPLTPRQKVICPQLGDTGPITIDLRENSADVTNDTLAAIAMLCPTLKSLNLQLCSDITVDGMEMIFSSCQSME
jgi:hypothetical protein